MLLQIRRNELIQVIQEARGHARPDTRLVTGKIPWELPEIPDFFLTL